jgi:hypothetical protein
VAEKGKRSCANIEVGDGKWVPIRRDGEGKKRKRRAFGQGQHRHLARAIHAGGRWWPAMSAKVANGLLRLFVSSEYVETIPKVLFKGATTLKVGRKRRIPEPRREGREFFILFLF